MSKDWDSEMWSGYRWHKWFAPPVYKCILRNDKGGTFVVMGPSMWWHDVAAFHVRPKLQKMGMKIRAYV